MTTTATAWEPCIWIKWKAGAPATAWESWKGENKIKAAWNTQGEWDCMLWLDCATPEELEGFVWNELRPHEWVANTKSGWWKKWW